MGVRSPLALAALATVAVPGFDARAVRASDFGGEDDIAVVTDAKNARWVVRAPRSSAAGAALEAELVLLGGLARAVDDGTLPFDVPRVVGSAPLEEGGRAVMYRQLKGHPVALDRLRPGPGTAAALGRAIAALHELPPTLAEEAGLPIYDAATYRARRLSEVDEAARTGRVPAGLLRRWEERLEDVAMWKFSPVMVHGDLSADHVLAADGEVTGVLSWGEAKVADPADDLSWLLVAAPQDAVDAIMEAYQLRRTELTDPFLADRALLAGELALVRWLLYGVRTRDDEVIADAVSMLDELDEQTREQPETGSTPAAVQD
ncbi:aminoglycoside phosphotransferase [Cellulomonas denverensis]|uniref:Phosphotransferase n=1 Tax=Cellulomonas denverensis TaxID=264297 RepID=A0A7X6KUT8_9CELL|nr:phosphotransferase [Cellulomonas denverensis]GIG26317.1 aminoglycoside phosphotransferase [Cellulomonas denverensis]